MARAFAWSAWGLLGLLLLVLVGCTSILPNVPKTVTASPAMPPVLAAKVNDPAITTLADWSQRRVPWLRAAFERDVYGLMPPPGTVRVIARTPLDDAVKTPEASFEQLTLAFGEAEDAPRAHVVLAVPRDGRERHAAVIIQNFCGNRAALPNKPVEGASLGDVPDACHGTITGQLVRAIFGQYANAPPWQKLFARHYAVAILYAGDVVPDDPVKSAPVLAALSQRAGTSVSAPNRTGAIAAWAWSYSRVVDVLAADPRIDPARIAVWGHSRNGKAALLAGATDPRIALVIAHQAGRGGSALSRSEVGEPLAKITTTYPHWFAPAYASYANRTADLPIDQHELIAMIAPRPVMLGQGRQDQWADPQSTFRAAQGATAVYQLFGKAGFTQTQMVKPDIDADIAMFMRDGRHGVHTLDWDYFLAFMDRHLRGKQAQ